MERKEKDEVVIWYWGKIKEIERKLCASVNVFASVNKNQVFVYVCVCRHIARPKELCGSQMHL